jgi:hypothetical protein
MIKALDTMTGTEKGLEVIMALFLDPREARIQNQNSALVVEGSLVIKSILHLAVTEEVGLLIAEIRAGIIKGKNIILEVRKGHHQVLQTQVPHLLPSY